MLLLCLLAAFLCAISSPGSGFVGDRLSHLSTLNSVFSTASTYTANDWLTSNTLDNNSNTLAGMNALNAPVAGYYDFENHLVYQSDHSNFGLAP
ncbi:MAG: hypothetical protein WCS99_01290 [Limisphaerales bacterium]